MVTGVMYSVSGGYTPTKQGGVRLHGHRRHEQRVWWVYTHKTRRCPPAWSPASYTACLVGIHPQNKEVTACMVTGVMYSVSGGYTHTKQGGVRLHGHRRHVQRVWWVYTHKTRRCPPAWSPASCTACLVGIHPQNKEVSACMVTGLMYSVSGGYTPTKQGGVRLHGHRRHVQRVWWVYTHKTRMCPPAWSPASCTACLVSIHPQNKEVSACMVTGVMYSVSGEYTPTKQGGVRPHGHRRHVQRV